MLQKSGRLFVYPVSVRDFGLDGAVVARYEAMLSNPAAFLGPDPIHPDWLFYNSIHGLKATATRMGRITDDPGKAAALFLPIWPVALCQDFIFDDFRLGTGVFDHTREMCPSYRRVLRWLFWQSSWLKSNGSDHLFYSSDLLELPAGHWLSRVVFSLWRTALIRLGQELPMEGLSLCPTSRPQVAGQRRHLAERNSRLLRAASNSSAAPWGPSAADLGEDHNYGLHCSGSSSLLEASQHSAPSMTASRHSPGHLKLKQLSMEGASSVLPSLETQTLQSVSSVPYWRAASR